MLPLACTLLVDDDSATNYLNQLLLNRMGVTNNVLVALNGQEALGLFDTHCPEPGSTTCPTLILLDLKMPIMNGLEFLEAYAQLPEARRSTTVVVMLTTSANSQDVLRMQHLPIAEYLTKPLTKEKVANLLQKHFGYASAVN